MSFITSIKTIIKDCVVKLNNKSENKSHGFWIESIAHKNSTGCWKKTEYSENGEILNFDCSIDTPEIPSII